MVEGDADPNGRCPDTIGGGEGSDSLKGGDGNEDITGGIGQMDVVDCGLDKITADFEDELRRCEEAVVGGF